MKFCHCGKVGTLGSPCFKTSWYDVNLSDLPVIAHHVSSKLCYDILQLSNPTKA